MFPTLFLAARRSASHPASLLGSSFLDSQLREYPRDLLEELAKVEALVKELIMVGFKVRLVQAFSPYGVALSLRHRLGRGYYAVVNNQPVKITENIGEVVKKIKDLTSQKAERRLKFRVD